MKNLVISGYYGFGNIGDEAILYSIVNSLREVNEKFNITVLTSSYIQTRNKYNVNVISRNNIKGIIKAIKECDLFISGGGSLFQDVTSSRSFIFYIAQIVVALKFNKKIFIYGQGIGPINKKVNRKIFKHFINNVNFITLRDKDSYDEIKKLGINKPSIVVTADPVFSLKGMVTNKLRINERNNKKKKIGVCIRSWSNSPQLYKYIARICDKLWYKFEDIELVFIPFLYKPDYEFSKQVISEMKNTATIIDTKDMDFLDVMQIISDLDFTIGMRLHSLIFSSMCRVPFSGISYDPKIDSFLKQIGKKPVFNVYELDDKKIDECVENIVTEFQHKNYLDHIDEIENISNKNIEYLIKVLNCI